MSQFTYGELPQIFSRILLNVYCHFPCVGLSDSAPIETERARETESAEREREREARSLLAPALLEARGL